MARILVRPVRYDETGELRRTHTLDIRVDFVGDGRLLRPADGASRRAARHLLNGPWSLAAPEAVRRHSAPIAKSAAGIAGRPGIKIRVTAKGLVSVTADDIAAVGWNIAEVDPTRLQVSFRGVPVPARITGEADGSFDPGDRIEFYGIPGATRYANENVYWLSEEDQPGLRFPTRNVAPLAAPISPVFTDTAHFEESNKIYTLGQPAEPGDPHFFWAWFEDNPNPPRTMELIHAATLPGLDPGGGQAVLRATLAGRTDTGADPDHRIQFKVAGNYIGDTRWNGKGVHQVELPFDASLMSTGTNRFLIRSVPLTFPDIVFLDWFEVDYPRVTLAQDGRLHFTSKGDGTPEGFAIDGLQPSADPIVLDVSEPHAPVQLVGAVIDDITQRVSFEDQRLDPGRYLIVGDAGRIAPDGLELDAPSDLISPAGGADLIVVVPEGWEPALEPLVQHRRSQGLRVVLANLTDLADEFAGGNRDDLAIRDFVAHAYHHWEAPAPSYLLLVGEPSMDPQNFIDEADHHHLMPTHFGVTAAIGETMVDAWFGAVSGQDDLPDLAVGRFSVRSPEEAEILVQKTIAYETGGTAGVGWAKRVLLIASSESQFEDSLASAAGFVPPTFDVREHYRRLGASEAEVVGALEDGALMATFVGHGNVNLWADVPGGMFFSNSDARTLSNGAKLPLLVALNCLNGFVAHPSVPDSLAETFHNRSGGGALAVWSSSSLGYLPHYEVLLNTLYRTIFVDGTHSLGAATSGAVVETFLTSAVSPDLVNEMVLLGDPAGWIAIDADADGMADGLETIVGADPADRDSDDDGLLDGADGSLGQDRDGDGIPDVLDPDSDDDGLPDGLEAGIAVADPDTDIAAGLFRADTDPATTTDPFTADTDGGGAPDGAEDRDGNGRLDAAETDPLDAADDPVCAAGEPIEIAAGGERFFRLDVSGNDVVLMWDDESDVDPCLLYRVYHAPGLDHEDGAAAYRLIGVTGLTSLRHLGGATAGNNGRYLVVGWSPTRGEGPWGHYSP